MSRRVRKTRAVLFTGDADSLDDMAELIDFDAAVYDEVLMRLSVPFEDGSMLTIMPGDLVIREDDGSLLVHMGISTALSDVIDSLADAALMKGQGEVSVPGGDSLTSREEVAEEMREEVMTCLYDDFGIDGTEFRREVGWPTYREEYERRA
jgi:hypothetical protein